MLFFCIQVGLAQCCSLYWQVTFKWVIPIILHIAVFCLLHVICTKFKTIYSAAIIWYIWAEEKKVYYKISINKGRRNTDKEHLNQVKTTKKNIKYHQLFLFTCGIDYISGPGRDNTTPSLCSLVFFWSQQGTTPQKRKEIKNVLDVSFVLTISCYRYPPWARKSLYILFFAFFI